MMNLAKNIIVATAVTSVLAIADLAGSHAEISSPTWRPMRPLYAVSFDVGDKHVLSYYLSTNGLCDLTLMVTDRPTDAFRSDEIISLSTARFKAEIGGGKTARIDTTEGTALEYACATDSQAMMVRKVYRFATASLHRQNSE